MKSSILPGMIPPPLNLLSGIQRANKRCVQFNLSPTAHGPPYVHGPQQGPCIHEIKVAQDSGWVRGSERRCMERPGVHGKGSGSGPYVSEWGCWDAVGGQVGCRCRSEPHCGTQRRNRRRGIHHLQRGGHHPHLVMHSFNFACPITRACVPQPTVFQ